jgi:halogenation protein CepH
MGGGPAGSTLGAILAREGAKVTLVERTQFPRPHIGEALQPAAIELLDFHLGLGPLIAAQGFAKKYGAIYEWGEDHQRWNVLYDARLDSGTDGFSREDIESGDFEHSFQVDRSVFDKLLLDHAVERGVEVRCDVEAKTPIMDGDRVIGMTVLAGEREERLMADIVVDATGTRAVLGKHFGLTRPITDLKATATWCYVRGAGGIGPPLERDIQLIVTVPEGWVWFIPLDDERTSVGIVANDGTPIDPDRFWQILGDTSLPLDDITVEPGPRGQPFHHIKDWSYTHRRFVGEGWLMVGDAACFTDPILSGGVDFAIRGAANAAIAILRGADVPALEAYEAQLRSEFRAYLRLARYWYANNRAVEGLFWELRKLIPVTAISTPLRAFVYVTSGACDADAHFHVFTQAQEEKIFKQLGVDEDRLKDAIRRAKRHKATQKADSSPEEPHEG